MAIVLVICLVLKLSERIQERVRFWAGSGKALRSAHWNAGAEGSEICFAKTTSFDFCFLSLPVLEPHGWRVLERFGGVWRGQCRQGGHLEDLCKAQDQATSPIY